MPNINEAFPSKYLKAADLKGRNALVVMANAAYEKIGDDQKLILYFEGKEKGMVLNKTNANNIAHAYGDDTEDWKGHQIVLFEAMVDFQGKTVPAIRVRPPQARDKTRGPAITSGPQPRQSENPAMADDEIPF